MGLSNRPWPRARSHRSPPRRCSFAKDSGKTAAVRIAASLCRLSTTSSRSRAVSMPTVGTGPPGPITLRSAPPWAICRNGSRVQLMPSPRMRTPPLCRRRAMASTECFADRNSTAISTRTGYPSTNDSPTCADGTSSTTWAMPWRLVSPGRRRPVTIASCRPCAVALISSTATSVREWGRSAVTTGILRSSLP